MRDAMTPAEREKYRLQAKMPSYRRHYSKAVDVVQRAIQSIDGEWCCCISGGKDSIALASLCVEAGWRGDLFHFRHPETPLENTALCVAVSELFKLPLVIVDVPGAFDVYKTVGYFFVDPQTDIERKAARQMLKAYKVESERAAVEHGYVGQFWGLRKQESKYRSITIAKYGTQYQTQSRCTQTALPLAYWTGMDVWAYLIAHDLPWLSIYDCGDDRERVRSEITWLACEALWRHGQGARFRRANPALWAELCAKYPELSRYG